MTKRSSAAFLVVGLFLLGACHAPTSPSAPTPSPGAAPLASSSSATPGAKAPATSPTASATSAPSSPSSPSASNKAPVEHPSAGPTLELVVNHSKAKVGDTIVLSLKNRRDVPFETTLNPGGVCGLTFFSYHWGHDGKTYMPGPPPDASLACPTIAVMPMPLRLGPGESKEVLTIKVGPMYPSNDKTPIKITPGQYSLTLEFDGRSAVTMVDITS